VSGVERIRELGLGAMELEFVRGVHMSEGSAKEVKGAAEKNKVKLSVHAPYYINLNSEDKAKVAASEKRIFESARIGFYAGARLVTFHPAYYQASSPEKTMQSVAEALERVSAKLGENKIGIDLAPETTGKKTQFGSLTETIELCSIVKGIRPMVDFAHLHARGNGRFKSTKDFESAIDEIPGKFLKDLQMHVSCIKYSAKGELSHMNMKDAGCDFNYKNLLEALANRDVSGTIICESPNLEEDAMLMQKHWNSLK
jgi:deoxyribonuclease-4